MNFKVTKAPADNNASTPLTIPTKDDDVSIKVQSAKATAANDDAQYRFTLDELATACGEPAAATGKPADIKAVVAAAPIRTPSQQSLPSTAAAPAIGIGGTGNQKKMLQKMPPKSACPTAGSNSLFTPRSPEVIVYYLGQLIWADLHPYKAGWVPTLYVGRGAYRPLFLVQKGPAPGAGAVVSVSLDGDDYYIPRDDDYNNSMHFLTLVEQLIALQKKGTALPTIPTVQVLNP